MTPIDTRAIEGGDLADADAAQVLEGRQRRDDVDKPSQVRKRGVGAQRRARCDSASIASWRANVPSGVSRR